MTGFDVFKIYCSVKAHFTPSSNYDIFKYSGQTKVTEKSFEARRDKKFFYVIGEELQEDEIVFFFMANFIHNNHMWIGNFLEEDYDALGHYKALQTKINNLTEWYKSDIINIITWQRQNEIKFSDMLICRNGDHPILLKFLFQGMIELETFIILNQIVPFFVIFDKTLRDDILWEQISFVARQYQPFLNIDVEKMKNVLAEAKNNIQN